MTLQNYLVFWYLFAGLKTKYRYISLRRLCEDNESA